MIRPGWKLALGIVAVGIAFLDPSRAEGAPVYYTPYDMGVSSFVESTEPRPYSATYLGTTTDVREADGRLTNDRTGVSVAFVRPATVAYAQQQPREDFRDLPAASALQGISTPIRGTYQMRPLASNAAGTVLGLMPSPGSQHSDPWAYSQYYYTTRYADGTYAAPQFIGYQSSEAPILTESNQILWGGSSPLRLLDVTSGISSEIRRDLIPDELKDRYFSFGVRGISATGDLLVAAYRDYGDPGDEYLLSSTAQVAAVPEPSTLWLAAATIAGLACRARRRRDG